jgi:Protein of unknown function (DUF1688)
MHGVDESRRESDAAAAYSLLSAQAVRERAHRLLAIGLQDGLAHFRIELERMGEAIGRVLAVTRAAYPSLDVPLHARWRHFVVNEEDRWASLDAATRWSDRASRARAACDLAIVSVLLDAGAGPDWRYRDPATGESFGRSEGLALASLAMFREGVFSSSAADPLRADAATLMQLPLQTFKRGLQISPVNRLPGLDVRLDLLHRLGEVVAAAPNVFALHGSPRPGGLFDQLAALAAKGRISAPSILSEILIHLGDIWPCRLSLGGVPLGDCWYYPTVESPDATSGLVPLHKLSQWLAYSLIEPLQAGGIAVEEIDGLTGLAEYRNGGLFVDTGVLELRDPADAARAHDLGSPLVVEWRALTVALLDRLAAAMRQRLGLDAAALPLAKVLQGGTWAAGRDLARERRADGSPPIKVVADPTVF